MKVLLFTVLSVILSLISMPLIILGCKKFNLYDYHDERKIHSGNISRLGGLGIVFSFLVCTVLYLMTERSLVMAEYFPILVSGAIIFVFAIVDDILNLPAIVKLIVQLVAVVIVTFSGYRFNQIFGWQLPTVVSIIITFGWILGVTNAYNLIDGLDGLCGTLSFTTITTLGVLYLLSGNKEAAMCFILSGAILGFLCFNWPPAKLFMGDNGSQFLGFMIATLPFYNTSSEAFKYNKFLIMIVLTSFAVFDTIAAIWRRLRDKKPIMTGDRSHLHHKLINMGYSKKTALYLIAFIQTLLCLSVVVSYFLGAEKGMALLLESFSFMVVFFSIIHYTNRKVMLRTKNEATTTPESSV